MAEQVIPDSLPFIITTNTAMTSYFLKGTMQSRHLLDRNQLPTSLAMSECVSAQL